LTARGEDDGRDVEARLRKAGADAVFVAGDMTDAEGPVTIVETAVARYGRLDGAFNNVGGVVAPGRPADIDAADWMAELELNLTSVFYCLRAQLPALLAAGGGAVVNNASIAGTTGIGGLTAYVAAKHGVVGLTRAAALAHAGDGVRVKRSGHRQCRHPAVPRAARRRTGRRASGPLCAQPHRAGRRP
jgi:NAD(P)-dependent dehydrogenase (short-subunit alcohol dehydrogenase family)